MGEFDQAGYGDDRKTRVLRALRREPVDRLPVQTNYTAKMGRILAEHFGVPIEELPDRLDNHLLRVDISYQRPVNEDGAIEFDWWGAGWDTRTEGYWHSFAPLKESAISTASRGPTRKRRGSSMRRCERSQPAGPITSSRRISECACSNARGRCAGSTT